MFHFSSVLIWAMVVSPSFLSSASELLGTAISSNTISWFCPVFSLHLTQRTITLFRFVKLYQMTWLFKKCCECRDQDTAISCCCGAPHAPICTLWGFCYSDVKLTSTCKGDYASLIKCWITSNVVLQFYEILWSIQWNPQSPVLLTHIHNTPMIPGEECISQTGAAVVETGGDTLVLSKQEPLLIGNWLCRVKLPILLWWSAIAKHGLTTVHNRSVWLLLAWFF